MRHFGEGNERQEDRHRATHDNEQLIEGQLKQDREASDMKIQQEVEERKAADNASDTKIQQEVQDREALNLKIQQETEERKAPDNAAGN